AAFSPDGRQLATCGADRTVRLWQIDPLTFSSRPGEAEERIVRECQELRGHTDNVFAVVFHPDGKRLASAGRDRAVWLWDLDTIYSPIGRIRRPSWPAKGQGREETELRAELVEVKGQESLPLVVEGVAVVIPIDSRNAGGSLLVA